MRHYLFLRKFPLNAEYGGCEKHLLNWFKFIGYKNNKITLAVSNSGKALFTDRLKEGNIKIEVIELPINQKEDNFIKKFSQYFSLFRKVKPTHIILVQGGNFNEFGLLEALTGFIYSKGNLFLSYHIGATSPSRNKSRKYFGIIRGIGLWQYKRILYYLLQAYLARKIFAISNGVKESLIKLYLFPKSKIYVGYHGVDVNNFKPDVTQRNINRDKLNIAHDETIIISTARMNRQKCLDRLINSFDLAARNIKNIQLFLVGQGPLEKELIQLAEQKPSYSKIKFLGFCENVSDYLKMSDIFILSSDNEGLAIGLLEAMATGLVCIATETPGPSEIIKNGVNGFLVEKSETGILECLNKVLNMGKKERIDISNNARVFIEYNFDLYKNINNELEIFGLA